MIRLLLLRNRYVRDEFKDIHGRILIVTEERWWMRLLAYRVVIEK